MLWVIFSILTALTRAMGALIDKLVLSEWNVKPVVPLMFAGILSLLAGILVYLVQGFSLMSPFNIFLGLLAAAFFMLGTFIYFQAAKIEEISRVISLYYLVPFFVLIFSYFILGETLTFIKYLGVFLLVMGAMLVSRKNSMSFEFNKAFWLMILSAVCYGLNAVITKYLLGLADYWTVFSYTKGIGVGIVLIPIFYLNGSDLLSILRKNNLKVASVIAINELIVLLSGLFVTIAMIDGSATLVNALSSIEPFFVLAFMVILSIFYPYIMKEEISKSAMAVKLSAMILMFIGTILIA